jgi:hypothetical protein
VSRPPIARKRWSDGSDGQDPGVFYEYEIDVSDLIGIDPAPAMSRVITSKIDELRMADLARELDAAARKAKR